MPLNSPFAQRVIVILRSVPRGKVVAYGQVAALAGRPGAARGVAWILHSSSDAHGLPWQRVIGAGGAISLPRGKGFEEQRRRLRAEGIEVDEAGRVDLKRYRWEPGARAIGRTKGPTRAEREFLAALTKRKKGF